MANDGNEGLARLADRPFDLVLLDFALPERNGIEMLRDIRERDSELPVIMITAYGTVENAVNAMQAGATNFIQKPWDNEKLLADVRTRGWPPPRRRRSHPTEARAQAALQLREHHRQERAHAAHLRPGGAGRPQPLDGVAAGRERHRQGADRQSHPHELAAQGARVRAGEHRFHTCRTCWSPRCSGM